MADVEDPVSFADLGIRVTESTKDTCFGKIRSYETLSKLEIAFLLISLVSLLGALGLTIERLVSSPKDSPDFSFALLLILNICFCMYYVVNGVFFERPYEIGILVSATGVVWLYIVLNYAISIKGPFKLARLVVSSALSPCVIVMGVVLARNYYQSKNLIFRTVGAQSSFQDLCQTMFIFFDLLKADLQVSISLALLVLNSGNVLNTEDMVLLPLSIAFGLASFITAYLAARLENRPLAFSYVAVWSAIPAYAIYLIVNAARDLQSHQNDMTVALNAVIFVASVLGILVRGTCMWYGVKTYFNFGKGLKQKVYGAPENSDKRDPNKDENNSKVEA